MCKKRINVLIKTFVTLKSLSLRKCALYSTDNTRVFGKLFQIEYNCAVVFYIITVKMFYASDKRLVRVPSSANKTMARNYIL